jgi:hypothetical protein
MLPNRICELPLISTGRPAVSEFNRALTLTAESRPPVTGMKDICFFTRTEVRVAPEWPLRRRLYA